VRAREEAALSAAGHAYAHHVELGDVLDVVLPKEFVDEINYTLRVRGLRLVPTMRVALGRGTRQWECVQVAAGIYGEST
jgi:hypothetical protein